MGSPGHHPILCLLLLITTTTVLVAAATERCNPEDKKVLLSIKASFNNAYQFASWFPDRDCCTDWYMVACDRTTNRIISLTVLADANTTGTLPPAIGDLPYLQDLTFRKLPNLTGTIPSTVANLQYLTVARFDNNQLSGPVPSFFQRMNSLYELNLSFNRFSGSIPPELALATSLIGLDLSRNLLTGPIPDSFGHFKIGGKSPEIYGTAFYLTLSHNQLSGAIPTSLGSLNLARLDVSYNRLCGPIPNVGNLTSFDQSSYAHNKCLCGPPLPLACNSTS